MLFKHLSEFIVRVANLAEAEGRQLRAIVTRIGVGFALGAAITHVASPAVAPWLAGTLAVFTMLESVFDFCFGCVVYTYVALPLFRVANRMNAYNTYLLMEHQP